MSNATAPPLPAAYLDKLVMTTGADLGPKPERCSEAYADERIRDKITRCDQDRQQAGLWSINQALKQAGVAPGLRLHLVTAVTHLGRIAHESVPARLARSHAK